MTTQANIPAKWYVPFANGDVSRVEIPVTTADPTRASQTLGFPPLTMQPPESGGVPPQGEDFNGGMNQIARVAWWVLNGGGWPYDASFATQANIQGYPNGAKLQSADFRGDWISTTDGNQNNPDTTGTGWVPGFQYGVTALTGLTGGTVTPTPAQAAKNSITLAGTLTSALTIVLPNWLKNWTITNNTTGAFVTIVKTAAGSGVTIPQNGAPTRVSGDGTNIAQSPENIAPAVSANQASRYDQLASQASITATVAGNALTLGLTAPLPLWFRNATLTNGAPVSLPVTSNLSLVVPSGASLGTIAAQQATLVLLVAYNGGSPVLCVANIGGAGLLDETNLISPTTISAGATSASVIYSASAVSANSPYRVVGVVQITEATPGTWATAPTLVQGTGVGGQPWSAFSSLGNGQVWTNVSGSRTLGTTYYNTTGRPIMASVQAQGTTSSAVSVTIVVNGVTVVVQNVAAISGGFSSPNAQAIIPPGHSYSATVTGGSSTAWLELR